MPTQQKRPAPKSKKGKKKLANKPILPYLLFGFAIAMVVILGIEINSCLERNSLSEVNTDCDFCREATASISSKKSFDDYNELHLQHARRNGLRNYYRTNEAFEADLDSLLDNGILVKISTNKYYHLDRLKHSHPYLTPEAAELLQEIGIRFNQKLRERDLARYKFFVTSLLRTEETQKSLRHVNVQATQNASSHYYGTTFDINYRKFFRWGLPNKNIKTQCALEQALKETLTELRQECRLLIVHEKRNSVYHITVVKCGKSKE